MKIRMKRFYFGALTNFDLRLERGLEYDTEAFSDGQLNDQICEELIERGFAEDITPKPKRSTKKAADKAEVGA